MLVGNPLDLSAQSNNLGVPRLLPTRKPPSAAGDRYGISVVVEPAIDVEEVDEVGAPVAEGSGTNVEEVDGTDVGADVVVEPDGEVVDVGLGPVEAVVEGRGTVVGAAVTGGVTTTG